MKSDISMSTVQEHCFANSQLLVESLVKTIVTDLHNALDQREQATLILSGGRTPIPLFRLLRQQLLPWSRICISLSDDRWVAADHPDSNAGLVRRELLVGAAAQTRFVPLTNSAADPWSGHAESERLFQQLPRPLDVVILGMGDDGHTASLFPGSPELEQGLHEQAAATFAAMPPAGINHPRVSLTLATLLDSRQLYLHIEGERKWQRYLAAREPGPVEHCPVRAILQQRAVPLDLYWSP